MVFRLHFESVSRYLSATILRNSNKPNENEKKIGGILEELIDLWLFKKFTRNAYAPQAFGKILLASPGKNYFRPILKIVIFNLTVASVR